MNELKSLLNLRKEIVQKVLHVAQQFEKLKLERNNFKMSINGMKEHY